MTRSLLFLTICCCFPATFAEDASAAPWIRLTLDREGWSCNVAPSSDVVMAYAVLENNLGEATGVSFGAPGSPSSGYTFLTLSSPFPFTGDAQSGFDIQFGGCIQGDVHVMTLFAYRTSAGQPCSPFQLSPHPGYGEVRYADCQFVQHRADRGGGIWLNSTAYCNYVSAPYHPYPPDGATDIPLLTPLEWSFDIPDCGELSGRWEDLYFGTSPNPSLLDGVGSPHAVGPLQPSTTYYWKIVAQAYGAGGASPVWSFTTTSSVATKSSTWGAIKSLYR